MSKLSSSQIEQLVAWREKGLSCEWIAQRLGVSASAVNFQCLRNGAISPNQRGRSAYKGPSSFTGKDGRTFRRFTDEEDTRLRDLAATGLRIREIAEQLGRAPTSIRMRMLLLGQHEDIAA